MDVLVPPLSAEMRRLKREIAHLELQNEKVRQLRNLQRQCQRLTQPLLAHLLQLLPGGQWELLTMFAIVIIVAMLNICVRVRLQQATYASANNDLKDTKAYREADVSGLYNISTAMTDYRSHRMVAQGVSPGILQGGKSDSILYGSVDNRKKIFWNKDFHPMDTAKEADAQKSVSALADQGAEIACGPNVFNECKLAGGQEVTIVDRKDDLSSIKPSQTSDVLDLCLVVQHFVPVSSEAEKLVETGNLQLSEGMLFRTYTLFSEAFSFFQKFTHPMHREAANCCRYLAMVLYPAGDFAGAIIEQHRELITNKRSLGLDHTDIGHSDGNIALFYHGRNQTELALRHMSFVLSLSSGPDHPVVAASFTNVAMMYQDIGKTNTALHHLQEAVKKNERLLGEDHIQTDVCYHALAIAFNCHKRTYDIHVKQLCYYRRTQDSQCWMEIFKICEQQMNEKWRGVKL